jgi:hypothetical protein
VGCTHSGDEAPHERLQVAKDPKSLMPTRIESNDDLCRKDIGNEPENDLLTKHAFYKLLSTKHTLSQIATAKQNHHRKACQEFSALYGN